MKRKAIICDIDNTILDIRHRFHLLDGANTDWDTFLAEDNIKKDVPIRSTVEVISQLSRFYPIIFVTGRNEGTRKITEEQIQEHCGLLWCGHHLLMRKDGDIYRKDVEVKSEIYREHVEPYFDVLCAFDDKPSIIDLWRSFGITAYHVGELATGDGY